MEGVKKIAVIVGLALVIVLAGVFISRRVSRPSGDAPDSVMKAPSSKIDEKTLEVIVRSKAEWAKLGRNEFGRWKNPKTGEYTVLMIEKCPNCGKAIPRIPDIMRFSTSTRVRRKPKTGVPIEEPAKIEVPPGLADPRTYKCPYCGVVVRDAKRGLR